MTEQKKNDEKLLDHNYDGIQELDNPLPGWWLYGFYLCIIFAVFYFAYYQLGPGPSLDAVYQGNVAAILEQRAANQPPAGADEAPLMAALKDPAAIEKGKALFADPAFCMPCHGAQGQGIVGPNLTDKFWIHGGQPMDMLNIIRKGVLDKGMPVWAERLTPEQQYAAVAFIASIQGSNPPGAKAPQGTAADGSPAAAPASDGTAR